MWSYYSNNHTGFCIGFNGDLLIFSLVPGQGKFPTAISYGNYPIVDPIDQSPESMERWGDLLWTKADSWGYESEHRLIGNAGDKLKLKPGAIEQVILGINVTSENSMRIIEILSSKEKKPMLYQAYPAVGAFKIELEEMLY